MRKISLLFLIATTSTVFGQRNLTIEETVFGPRTYAPQNMVSPSWAPNTTSLFYLDNTYQNLMSKSAATNWKENTAVSKSDLTSALQQVLPNEKFKINIFPYDYSWKNAQQLLLNVEGDTTTYSVIYDIQHKKIAAYIGNSTNGENRTPNSDLSKTAYTLGNNIFITDKNGQTIAVTKDTTDGITNGSNYVHRQEFGINKGMWWNPANDQLLYYHKNETMVAKYPLIQWTASPIATVKDTRYPMAGQTSEEVSLIVYNLKTNQKITLQTEGPKDQYLTIPAWDPSGKFIYVGVLNRGQNDLKFNKYDASTGAFIQTLFEEKSSTWVEPQVAVTFLPNRPDQFLYQTDKDGYNQLYLYNTNGKLIKKLGFEQIIVDQLKDFSTDGNKISYIGVTNNGLDRQLFEVDLRSGKTTQVTKESGYHNATLNSTGTYVLDQYSNLTTPNQIVVKSLKSDQQVKLIDAPNPFQGKINPPKIEFIDLKTADGKFPLTGRIIYPADFDASKKYPVMYYLYGGSHSQLVSNRWLGGAGYFDLYMAQQGYVVFTMDNRGTNYRGRDFSTVTHRQLGQNEMADQMQGIQYLKSLPFVDQTNMGIFGWSFGGFMTTSMMVSHNDIFKAAVAGGPVIDWKYYEVMYGERYMDTPQENPEGYSSTSLLNKASKLKGNLLIIHGAQDPVVVQQNSMQFIQACIQAGKQVDYFLYPTHEHNVMGKDRIHMYQKIAQYFDQNLKK